MGKGMQETNECSRQESGNVETIVPPPQDSAGGGCKHIGREGRGVRKVTPERQTVTSIQIFIFTLMHAACIALDTHKPI